MPAKKKAARKKPLDLTTKAALKGHTYVRGETMPRKSTRSLSRGTSSGESSSETETTVRVPDRPFRKTATKKYVKRRGK